MLSSEIPVSEDATKFNKGAFGGVRSKLICKAVEAALILPALSAMLAVKLFMPSAPRLLTVTCATPALASGALRLFVPMTCPPDETEITLPALT